MPFDPSELLVVAISSSTLFDTREGHEIHTQNGLEAYIAYQLLNEEQPLAYGPEFPLIASLLLLNKLPLEMYKVEVVILSQNEPGAGLRIINSVEHHKLDST